MIIERKDIKYNRHGYGYVLIVKENTMDDELKWSNHYNFSTRDEVNKFIEQTKRNFDDWASTADHERYIQFIVFKLFRDSEKIYLLNAIHYGLCMERDYVTIFGLSDKEVNKIEEDIQDIIIKD